MFKSAEEVAREMVSDPIQYLNEWQVRLGECGLHTSILRHNMVDYAADVRAEVVTIIERSRAEGAAAERERLAAHAGRPAEEVAAEMVPEPNSEQPWWHPALVDAQAAAFLDGCEGEDPIGTARGILARLIARERVAAYAQGKADGAREE